VVAPTPDPQRRLPSLNSVQKKPSLQSLSLEQVSHSSFDEQPKPITGIAASNTINKSRDRRIVRVPSLAPRRPDTAVTCKKRATPNCSAAALQRASSFFI
jgi:hypothetical protein